MTPAEHCAAALRAITPTPGVLCGLIEMCRALETLRDNLPAVLEELYRRRARDA